MLLPTPTDLKRRLPLNAAAHECLQMNRLKAEAIVTNTSPLFAIVMGPCSIHDVEAALEYGRRLKTLSERMEGCFLVMRVFCEKPRTVMGWKGLIYDPHLDGSNDIATGLFQTRKLLLQLAEMGVPCCTEFVDPITAPYIEDLISWGVIGARTSASQPHRQLASSLSFPTGFKNSTEGNVHHAINGVIAANAAHDYFGINEDGKICIEKSTGNPLAHVILRGSHCSVNYTPDAIASTCDELLKKNLSPRLLVDCSHGNCQRDYQKQVEAFRSVVTQRKEGNEHIFGAMLESHLEEGSQKLEEDLLYGVSVTDPCLDWSSTEELVLWADAEVASTFSVG
jgi:3-deoxy-7-phosphoheptulonate synthase